MIDAEGSELLREVFNRMTTEQKNSVAPEYATRISLFMHENGYRLVFSRWYYQADPLVPNNESNRLAATNANEDDKL